MLAHSSCVYFPIVRNRIPWEGHIVAFLLILALLAPLIAVLAIVKRIPFDFAPSSKSLPSAIFGFSSAFLLFGAGSYFMPVATFPLLGFGLALGLPAAAALLLWRTTPSDGDWPANCPTLIAVAFAYSCGLIYLLNGVLTPGPATRVISTVVSKRVGIGGYPNHFLHLSSLDPRVGDGEWRVSSESFFASHAGAQACVDLYQGRFGAIWYRAGPCPVMPAEIIPWVGFSSPFSGRLRVEF